MISLIYCSKPCKMVPYVVQIATVYASLHNNSKFGRQYEKYYSKNYTRRFIESVSFL